MVQVRLIPAAAVVVLKVILFGFSGKGIFCLGFILLLAMRVCLFFPYDTMSGNRIESDPLCLSSELIRLIALLFYVISFDFFSFLECIFSLPTCLLHAFFLSKRE